MEIIFFKIEPNTFLKLIIFLYCYVMTALDMSKICMTDFT